MTINIYADRAIDTVDNGYCYFQDGNDVKAFDNKTGEVFDTISIVAPIGTLLYTPEQQEKYKRKKQLDAENARKAHTRIVQGRFVFVKSDQTFNGLTAATAARLMYLCAFLSYNNNLIKNGKTITRSDLTEILKLPASVVSGFINETKDSYLTILTDNTIQANNAIFQRGKLTKENIPSQKLFIRGVKELYERTQPRQHKHLGFLFCLLPYINLEYNILCNNTTEKEISLIDPITLKDFCNLINYDISNLARLKKIYRDIRFNVDGREQRFVAFVNDGIDIASSRIVINPSILYAGTDPEKVRAFTSFF